MSHPGRRTQFAPWYWIVAALLCLHASADDPEHVLDDSRKFISRPDLEAPTWNITTFDGARISPGYWFVEPYDYLDQSTRNGGNWTAPMIFDQEGELIWSGAHLSQQYDSFDFKLSNVLGEDMLTWLYPHNRSLVVLDTQFQVRKQLQISSPEKELDNMHDLNFVNDGTRALFFYDETKEATSTQSEAVGFTDGKCLIRENSFREVDLTEDWRVVYRWSSSKRIDLTESTFTDQPIEKRCKETKKVREEARKRHIADNMALTSGVHVLTLPQGWDWIHVNSVDKFLGDGSYLMSGRHTDTIYKISRSGEITWRLGGAHSDFVADFEFRRQHHARILSHNDTHTTISFFDNASAEDKEKGTAKWSRGLLVALRTDTVPMTATMLAEYGHPDGPGSFTLGRGSTQVLPDGNVFSCWVNGCLQSEHSPDGTLLMEARVKQQWLKSYRSYKFPFVGRPAAPPDVYAVVSSQDTVRTTVHVSWNGATEVAGWRFYKTTKDGKSKAGEAVAESPRTGFETALDLEGYATFVVLEAIDSDGKTLGRSDVFETVVSSDLPEDILEAERQWLERVSSSGTKSWKSNVTSKNGAASLVGGLFFIVAGILAFRIWRRRGRRWMAEQRDGQSYEMVDRDESAFELGEDEEDERTSLEKPSSPVR